MNAEVSQGCNQSWNTLQTKLAKQLNRIVMQIGLETTQTESDFQATNVFMLSGRATYLL